MNVRRHIRRPRASTVLASLALFVALGGSATAATLITGATIKNGTITGKDLKGSTLNGSQFKNGSLGSSDLGKSTKASLKGTQGDRGPAGQAGTPGGQGAPGPNGVKAPQTGTVSANINGGGLDTEIMEKAVPAGGYMVSVKGYMFSPDVSQITCRLLNGATVADRIDWDATTGGQRMPARLAAVVTATTGSLSVHCQKTGAGAGVFSLVQLIAIPTS
jgi:hypothetical protein